jgi:CrcB protein
LTGVLKELLIVGLGAFLGGLARYLCMIAMPNYLFFVNTLGSFLAGIFYFKLYKTFPNQHLLINVGFLGAFTTFSSFSLLVFQQLNDGLFLKALLYVVLKVLAGVLFCFLGYKLASNVLI